MRKIFFLAILLIFESNLFATTYTSISNGNWSTPTIWSPAGVPQPGDDVIINTDVVMDDTYTSGGYWSVSGGSIIINANASFVQGANVIGIAIQNGGTITNNGTFNFDQLGIYDGIFTNNGTANCYQLIYNLGTVDNYGIIQEVDSFYTSGTCVNNTNATILSDSIHNEGVFTNNGVVTVVEFLNDSTFTNNGTYTFNRYYNAGSFENYGQVTCTLDATNAGYWYNAQGSQTDLSNNFTNSDGISTTYTAVFENDGIFNIGNDWSNLDTTKGNSTGAFYIQGGTYNEGVMTGSFLFCDQTPTTTIEPIIDYNTGIIDSNITYCAVNIELENNLSTIRLFPNPTNKKFFVTGSDITKIQVLDIRGKILMSKQVTNGKISFDITNWTNGIYFVKIFSISGNLVKKLVIN